MADAMELPIAPHTAGGPLLFYASTHLSTAEPNVWIQESCQRFYEHDWPLMLENPIAPKDGSIEIGEEPGFGMRIKPEAWSHPAAVRQISGEGLSLDKGALTPGGRHFVGFWTLRVRCDGCRAVRDRSSCGYS